MRGRGPQLLAVLGCCAVLTCTPMRSDPPPPNPELDAGTSSWRVVLDELPGTLLSTWESGDGVLYAVGGTPSGALVLRHDGGGWWLMDPGTSETLWWVHGFSTTDVYAVGEHGVVTHFDGTNWRVVREGGDFTFFGAWGVKPGELVVVGGAVNSSAARPVIVSQRLGWNEVPTIGLPADRALFKIWGTSDRDLYVVGEGGLIARGELGAFLRHPTPTIERLLTVSGSPAAIYAVGGLREPVLLRNDGPVWRTVNIPGDSQPLLGVAVRPDGETAVVGMDGYLAEGADDVFEQVPALTRQGLHSVTAVRNGFVVAGGELLREFGHGVLLARGQLQGGPIRAWPHAGLPFDAGSEDAGMDGGMDAGIDAGTDAGIDAGVDAGLGPGAACGSGARCQSGLNCFSPQGSHLRVCTRPCMDETQCGDFGPGACCSRLILFSDDLLVCMTRDAGVCDAG